MLTRSKRKLEIARSMMLEPSTPMDFFDFTELLEADPLTKEFLAAPFTEFDEEEKKAEEFDFEYYNFNADEFEDYDGDYYKEHNAELRDCSLCEIKEAMRSIAVRLIVEKYKIPVGPRFVGFNVYSFMFPLHVRHCTLTPELNRMDYFYICSTCERHAKKYFHELGEVTMFSEALKEQVVIIVSDFEPIAKIILAYANTDLSETMIPQLCII